MGMEWVFIIFHSHGNGGLRSIKVRGIPDNREKEDEGIISVFRQDIVFIE